MLVVVVVVHKSLRYPKIVDMMKKVMLKMAFQNLSCRYANLPVYNLCSCNTATIEPASSFSFQLTFLHPQEHVITDFDKAYQHTAAADQDPNLAAQPEQAPFYPALRACSPASHSLTN